MTFKVNGVDFSPYFNNRSYNVSYSKREGNNGGMLLDGSYKPDVLAFKVTITRELNALNDVQLETVLSALVADVVELEFYDPRVHRDRTANFMPSLGGESFAFSRHGLQYYRDGTEVTFEEC